MAFSRLSEGRWDGRLHFDPLRPGGRPAGVVTTALRLNEPRFIKLPDIMKAKPRPLEAIPAAELGVDTSDTLKTK